MGRVVFPLHGEVPVRRRAGAVGNRIDYELMDDEGQGLNDKGGYGNNGTRQPDSRRTEGIDLLTNDLLQGNLRRDHPADRTGREFEADRPASR